MENEPNQRIGDYEILGLLGAGGMGKVYRVRNVISDRIEAMKILLPSLSDHREVGERFLREIKLVASLHHPNIANLCTAQTFDNHLVMVMEFVDGSSFSDLLDSKAISLKDALNYFDQALAALGYAHGKGIVHRDIKPSNIMLTPEGVVKLMDFGIARSEADRALTQTGATIGTVSYMSPEQIAGKVTDGRSDLYSMGIFIYETVTGEQPFKGTSDYELMAAHINQTPRPPAEFVPGIPDALNAIILKLLAKTPEQRFQTAESVREAIRALPEFDGAVRPPQNSARAAVTAPMRQATTVEGFRAPSSSRMATTVEPRSTGTLVRDAYTERRITEVAGMPTYGQTPSTALVVQKKGFARHPALYAGGGIVLAASAIALPLVYAHRDGASDRKDVVASSSPVATTPTGAPPAGPVVANPTGGGPGGRPPALPPGGTGQLPGRQPQPLAGTLPKTGGAQGKDLPGAGNTSLTASIVVQPGTGTAAPAPSPPAIDPALKAKLDDEEIQIDQLTNRAASINNSLNTMQRSMQKDGISMRGDIATKQAGMNTNLSKAKQALATHDADRAGKFAAMAETQEGELEAFLGR